MTAAQMLRAATKAALEGMKGLGPRGLLDEVNRNLGFADEQPVTESELLELLFAEGEPQSTAFHLQLGAWDLVEEGRWIFDTKPLTDERRTLVLSKLAFSDLAAAEVNETFPPNKAKNVFIEDADWEPWYAAGVRQAHSFYWDAYRTVLEKSLPATSIQNIDETTNRIISRLSDPCSGTPYQAKGLVVGHVQSGKTANFTGVIAKAMDVGYRLIIVLTGTYDILRDQTQRRLDKELVGRENILGGIEEEDVSQAVNVDYWRSDDQDWQSDKFVRHGAQFWATGGIPRIRRLTTSTDDYKALKQGLPALDFRAGNELKFPNKGVWAPENLFTTDVRLMVIKKNSSVLAKILGDLKKIHADLGEIPTLILDDEADLASVNTTQLGKVDAEGKRERTAINKRLSELLDLLKRAQYVGYTATPFANVFVDPEDVSDIFPRDFVYSLEPSSEYMGGAAFHDLDGLPDDVSPTPALSNKAAFVRELDHQPDEDADLMKAIDAFVLTGAIKLWREANPDHNTVNAKPVSYYHHTMLVHESVTQQAHAEMAKRIDTIWNAAAYSMPSANARLRELFESDFLPVWQSRRETGEWGAVAMPDDFEDLVQHLGRAVDRITSQGSPVVVVNGDTNSDYQKLNFQAGRVWRILVGGAKLSRGFTVEELTITYYRRRSQAADSLMQMGRWFGYRRGYRDLVRLFIATQAEDPKGKSFNLYEAFEAILRDERDFRDQLLKFSLLREDDRPVVRPIDIPPLVFQSLPWLRPSARNKMYNAELAFEGDGGVVKDFPRQPDRNKRVNAAHFVLVKPWAEQLSAPDSTLEFTYRLANPDVDDNQQDLVDANSSVRSFRAWAVVADAEDVRGRLSGFRWAKDYTFEPTLHLMDMAIAEGTLSEWVILTPDLTPYRATVDGVSVPLLQRSRREDRPGFSGSSFRQRHALQHIAGNPRARYGGPEAERLMGDGTRGAMLLTFSPDLDFSTVRDEDRKGAVRDALEGGSLAANDIASLFSLVFPYRSAPAGRVGFRVRRNDLRDMAVVDKD
ncbi:Z1 domain-containing protein [Leifsonia sp. Le1]|uniref:Z1 domain-containing protein n=1 Tax=Leifsonia sp. Le1 TaxID=3404918 RepID=UPI003EBF6E6D